MEVGSRRDGLEHWTLGVGKEEIGKVYDGQVRVKGVYYSVGSTEWSTHTPTFLLPLPHISPY